jgi:hypothetical protein
MTHYIQTADAWLIDKFERFSQFTERWFGMRAVQWERLFGVIGTFILLNEGKFDWLTAVLIFCQTVWLIDTFQRLRTRVSSSVTANRFRHGTSWAVLRVFCTAVVALILPWDTIGYIFFDLPIDVLYLLFIVLQYYFMACDDLPWQRSRLRLFLRSLFTPAVRRRVNQ